MVTESWKRVPIEGLQEYEVSDYGRVRHNSKILKPSVTRGYYSVGLCTAEHKKTTIHVHKLVALAFLKNAEGKKWINHKDGIKTNNHVDNIEWCTPSENQKHSWKTGLTVFTDNMRKAVTKSIMAAVEKQKRRVKCFGHGELLEIYESASEAARQIHGNQAHISDCCNGKRHTHKGFSWAWA